MQSFFRLGLILLFLFHLTNGNLYDPTPINMVQGTPVNASLFSNGNSFLTVDEGGLLLYSVWYNTETVLLSCFPYNSSGALEAAAFENLVIWQNVTNPIVRVTAVCPDDDMLVVAIASCAETNVLVFDNWGTLVQTIPLQGQQDIARFDLSSNNNNTYTKNPGQGECLPQLMSVFVWESLQYETYSVNISFWNVSDMAFTESFLYITFTPNLILCQFNFSVVDHMINVVDTIRCDDSAFLTGNTSLIISPSGKRLLWTQSPGIYTYDISSSDAFQPVGTTNLDFNFTYTAPFSISYYGNLLLLPVNIQSIVLMDISIPQFTSYYNYVPSVLWIDEPNWLGTVMTTSVAFTFYWYMDYGGELYYYSYASNPILSPSQVGKAYQTGGSAILADPNRGIAWTPSYQDVGASGLQVVNLSESYVTPNTKTVTFDFSPLYTSLLSLSFCADLLVIYGSGPNMTSLQLLNVTENLHGEVISMIITPAQTNAYVMGFNGIFAGARASWRMFVLTVPASFHQKDYESIATVSVYPVFGASFTPEANITLPGILLPFAFASLVSQQNNNYVVALAIPNPQESPLVLALALGSLDGNGTDIVELTYQNGQFEITKNISLLPQCAFLQSKVLLNFIYIICGNLETGFLRIVQVNLVDYSVVCLFELLDKYSPIYFSYLESEVSPFFAWDIIESPLRLATAATHSLRMYDISYCPYGLLYNFYYPYLSFSGIALYATSQNSPLLLTSSVVANIPMLIFADCPAGMRSNEENYCSLCPQGTAGPLCQVKIGSKNRL